MLEQGIRPRLAIIKANQNTASSTYIGAKQRYGGEVEVIVDVYDIDPTKLPVTINDLNSDASVQGIIVQLPLPDQLDTDKIIEMVADSKDVDGLKPNSPFDPSTPTAIIWLMAEHKIDLENKSVLLIGQGRLVGKPLAKILERSHIKFTTADEYTNDLDTKIRTADVIISATGQPGLIKPNVIKKDAVIIDAGTSEAGGKVVGDVDPALYQSETVRVSPVPGGVGPLTVCALFANLIKAAGGNESQE